MMRPDTRAAALWAGATAAITIAPHAMYVPLWVTGCSGALLCWYCIRIWRSAAPPGRMLRLLVLLLAAAIAGGIRLDYGYLLGSEPGVAMLAVLLSMKLLEGSTSRDLRAAILLALFLQLGLFFNDQTLSVAALALIGALCATATLLALEEPSASPLRALRTGCVLMLQGLPFLLVLFLLFPRIPGPLWGLPADANRGITGLSDEMSPGSIAELGSSDEIAMRIEFAGAAPPPAQRYWRGPVLTSFDGRVWRARSSLVQSSPPYTPSGPRYDYVAIIEPHNRRWVLALDFPGPSERESLRHTNDLQLLSDSPLRERTRVTLSAYPETAVGLDETPFILEQALALPPTSGPRTRALVEELIHDASTPQDVLDRILAFMQQQQLTYTLSPPLLGAQPVDEFLLDTRRGFCEHFSSAFVFMMRAAGVPARVVTGYLGGTINTVDGSMVVRQSDAHAWAEVWLPQRGWVRVDPTALAAPSRIEQGLSSALPAGDPRPLLMGSGRAVQILRGMRDRWEALSNAWDRHVLGFDQQRQLGLLARLGFREPSLHTLAMAVAGAVVAVMLTLIGWTLMRRRSGDALDRLWQRFCARLARRGLARLPSEGPMAYAERVALALPERAAQVREIATLYSRLRYGASRDDNLARTRELAKCIREFSPQ